jgi:hypothetical protein
MLKNLSKQGKKSSFNSPVPSDSILEDSTGWIAREFWWTNQEFPLSISFQASPCSYITWRMNNRSVGDTNLETFHPIDMIIMMIIIHTLYSVDFSIIDVFITSLQISHSELQWFIGPESSAQSLLHLFKYLKNYFPIGTSNSVIT